MKHLVDDCFSTLHRLTSEKAGSVCAKRRSKQPDEIAAVQRRAFKLGIDYILHSWDDKIKEEECSSALQQFPNIQEEYTHCVQQYCESLRNRAGVRGHRTFSRFLYSYICAIASSKEMGDMAYFEHFHFGDKDAFLKELFRTTLMESVRYRGSTHTPGDEKSTSPSVLTASTRMSRTASAAARSAERIMEKDAAVPPRPSTDTAARPTRPTGSLVTAALRHTGRSVIPSDSVSNAPFRGEPEPSTLAPSLVSPSPSPSQGSTASVTLAAATPNERPLTRSLLDTHDKRLTSQGTTVRLGAPLPSANIKNITLCM